MISDSVPKVIARKVLSAVFRLARPIRLTCREGDLRDLVTQSGAHQLDANAGSLAFDKCLSIEDAKL